MMNDGEIIDAKKGMSFVKNLTIFGKPTMQNKRPMESQVTKA